MRHYQALFLGLGCAAMAISTISTPLSAMAETVTTATVAEPVLETPAIDTIETTVNREQSPVTTINPSLHQQQNHLAPNNDYSDASNPAAAPHHTPQAAYYTPQAVPPSGVVIPPPTTVQTKTTVTTEYRPLPGILVLAIPNVTNGKKGFADAAWTLGTEVAKKLAHNHPHTTIYYPAQSIAKLERQHPYLLQTVWRQWAENNHVSPTALNHLTDAVAGSGGEIARVVMVQADVDFNQPEKSWGLRGLYKKHFGDHIPDDMRAYMRSTISIVNTQTPNHDQIWQGSWQHPIKTKQYGNITASVYSDTDSLKAIDDASGIIGGVLLLRAPKASFTQPVEVTTTKVIAKKAGN